MINKALLDPWVKCKMEELRSALECQGIFGVVTSAYRSTADQRTKFQRCNFSPGDTKFPVKSPGCSQHEYGLAFDMVVGSVTQNIMPGRLSAIRAVLCRARPGLPFCTQPETRSPQGIAGDTARSLGLAWSNSDPVHFAAFPAGVFDSHMRARGFECRTCQPALEPAEFPPR